MPRLPALVLSILFALATSVIFSPTSLATDKAATVKGTVLITGANRGIGLALATKFKQEGYKVIGTARNPDGADELRKLGVRVEELDVTDKISVTGLSKRLRGETVDILINNAGIGGHSTSEFKDLDVDRLIQVIDVNSFGALRVTQALLPNLQKSHHKVVASISSRMGSIELNTNGSVMGYRASKTALNSFNKSLSIEFASQGFKFVVLHPGWVRTDMTSNRATYAPEESAAGLFKVISNIKPGDNGRFFDLHGKELAW